VHEEEEEEAEEAEEEEVGPLVASQAWRTNRRAPALLVPSVEETRQPGRRRDGEGRAPGRLCRQQEEEVKQAT